jgi:hypothetical protein
VPALAPWTDLAVIAMLVALIRTLWLSRAFARSQVLRLVIPVASLHMLN